MRVSGAIALLVLLSAVAIVAAANSTEHGVAGCASSTYLTSNGTCASCPQFSWSPANSASAADCTCWYGYTNQTDGSCAPISGGGDTGSGGGASNNSTNTNSTCNPDASVQDCPESQYSSTGTWDCTNPRSKCTKCPRYSYSPAGSDSKSDCVCWAGYQGPAGGPCKANSTSTSVDGGWCPASACSATCGGGTQTRECACPAPSGGGANCSGEATVTCASTSCESAPNGSQPCPESTYSANGMYMDSASECTACPDYSWSPAGSTAITACGCWDRYTGSAGGPCTFITGDFNGGWCPWMSCDSRCGSGTKTRVCGCPYQSGNGTACEGESSAACDGLQACGAQPTSCSEARSEDECWSWQGCVAVGGYSCSSGAWSSFIGCTTQDASDSSMKQATCAVSSSSGDRAWLSSTLLPPGYVATTNMGGVSCCTPQNCSSASASCNAGGSNGGSDGSGGSGNSGNSSSSGDFNVTIPGISSGGCTWQLGGACVVLQFRGQVPSWVAGDINAAIAWGETLLAELKAQLAQLNATEIDQLKAQLSTQLTNLLSGVDLAQLSAELSKYVTIVSPPTPNNGTGAGTYSVVVQLPGASFTLPYSPEQVVAAIQALLASGWLASTNIASQLQGIAAYASMTNTATPTSASSTASGADVMHASLMLVLATGIIGTLVAKVASFMQ